MKYLLWIVILFSLPFFFFTPKTAFASAAFTTDYFVTYTVEPNLTTHATMHVTLTNSVTDKYADSYRIEVGFDHIDHVIASDPDGGMTPVVAKTDNGNSIGVTFNKHVVGMGNKLNFTIDFDTPDITSQHGNIKEINVPGITNPGDFSSFNVEVKVPPNFGEPVYIKPEEYGNGLVFNKDMLGKSGISIAYGDKQFYAFTLSYHLQNTNLFPVKTEIALPPATNYQDIMISSLDPKPTNVTTDPDGNWLAAYTLLPTATLNITLTGKAAVMIHPMPETLTADERASDLKGTKYWNTTDPAVKALAKRYTTPKEIFDYVVAKLTYDYSRVSDNQERLGAVNVLQHPSSAVCLEFTDLFISMARAAGIPAREVDGYAYTENAKQRPLSLVQDVLHAWPEYYDTEKGTWVMVDPTWSNTTGGIDYFHVFDFDHLAFVIKGVSSDYPVPAGGYKLRTSDQEKDVDVRFTQRIPESPQQVTIVPYVPEKMLSAFPIHAHIVIKNSGQTSLPRQQLVITSQGLFPDKQIRTTDAIPPFGFEDISFAFYKKPFLTSSSFPVTMSVAGEVITKRITIAPFFTEDLLIIGGALIALFTISILIITIKSRRI